MIHEKEVFLPFEQFPWFREASTGKVTNVELASEQHLYWPDLDVDLELDSVFHPERYPLVSKVQEDRECYGSKRGAGEHLDDE